MMSGWAKLVSPIHAGIYFPWIGARRRYIIASLRRWHSSSCWTPLASRTYPWVGRHSLNKLPREPETFRGARQELNVSKVRWSWIRDIKSDRRKCRCPCSAAFGQFGSILLQLSVARPRRHSWEQYCPSLLIEACMVSKGGYDVYAYPRKRLVSLDESTFFLASVCLLHEGGAA